MDFLLWQIEPKDKKETWEQGFNREIELAIMQHVRRLGTIPNVLVLSPGINVETNLQVEYDKYMLVNCFGLRRQNDDR